MRIEAAVAIHHGRPYRTPKVRTDFNECYVALLKNYIRERNKYTDGKCAVGTRPAEYTPRYVLETPNTNEWHGKPYNEVHIGPALPSAYA